MSCGAFSERGVVRAGACGSWTRDAVEQLEAATAIKLESGTETAGSCVLWFRVTPASTRNRQIALRVSPPHARARARTHPADLFEAVVVGSPLQPRYFCRVSLRQKLKFRTLPVSVNAACGPGEFGPAQLGKQQLFNPALLEDGAELRAILPQAAAQVGGEQVLVVMWTEWFRRSWTCGRAVSRGAAAREPGSSGGFCMDVQRGRGGAQRCRK